MMDGEPEMFSYRVVIGVVKFIPTNPGPSAMKTTLSARMRYRDYTGPKISSKLPAP